MSWDTRILFIGVAAEALFAALLVWRRVYRTLPFFTLYILWSLISDIVVYLLRTRFSSVYIEIFIAEMSLDSLLQYGVLVELASSVFRPFRAGLPRRIVAAFAIIVVLLCAAAWPFTNLPNLAGLPTDWAYLMRLQQSFSFLRIGFFLVLAACSHMLGLGWRDRELQVASGLGFYSLASVIVSILHAHQDYHQDQFHIFDQLVAVSYLCALLYWLACFSRPAAPRRDLPPAMERLLVSLGGAASAQRTILESSSPTDRRDP